MIQCLNFAKKGNTDLKIPVGIKIELVSQKLRWKPHLNNLKSCAIWEYKHSYKRNWTYDTISARQHECQMTHAYRPNLWQSYGDGHIAHSVHKRSTSIQAHSMGIIWVCNTSIFIENLISKLKIFFFWQSRYMHIVFKYTTWGQYLQVPNRKDLALMKF